jgi:hypothetical protein
MVWVRERNIPTERSPLVGEVIAYFFADRGCHVVSMTDPYGRIPGFLDRSRYFSILTRLSGPRSRPTTFFSGSAGNRTRASESVAKNSDH